MTIQIGTNSDDSVTGTNGNDLILGLSGDDVIDAGDGHDIVLAGRGDDSVQGGDGCDLIFGGNGQDQIDGGADNDAIFGGRGDDTLAGGDGDDLLVGGNGDDEIEGGAGDDVLAGNRGDDLFIFEVGFGVDTVLDFAAGAGSPDRILLRDTQATSFADVLALASDVGGNVEISFANGDKLTLNGISVADLHPDDFLFETTALPLFDNTANSVDFNSVSAGTYIAGSQYDALDGDDFVTLASSAAAAAAAGYTVGTAFNAGAGNDTIIGGALDDLINGDAGNDTLDAGTGLDTLNGGDGDDRLILGDVDTDDALDGGAGSDTAVYIATGAGDHELIGRNNSLELDGVFASLNSVENFDLTGSTGNDLIRSFNGDDILRGGDGRDNVQGGMGVDQIFGGDGDDTLWLYDGNTGDVADGGAGTDLFYYADTINVDSTIDVIAGGLDVDGQFVSLIDIERIEIRGGGGNDTITGGAGDEVIRGGSGDDILTGQDGNDNLIGETGIDQIYGGDGDDFLWFYDADIGDVADGGAGSDTTYYFDPVGADSTIDITAGEIVVDGTAISLVDIETVEIRAGGGDDTITGSSRDELFRGGTGNDSLSGDAGNDILIGETGVDEINGGDGDDVLWLYDVDTGDVIDGGSGYDQFIYFDNLNVDSSITVTAASVTVNGETVLLTDIEETSIRSQGGNDTITGGSEDNIFSAGAGDDVMNGGGGNDFFLGGAGNDLFIFGLASDADIIADFDSGAGLADVVDISAYGFSAFDDGTLNDVESALSNQGTAALLDLGGGNQVLFYNTQATDFAADDFIV